MFQEHFKTLGIKVSPNILTYAIFCSENQKCILKNYIRPSFLEFPDFLKYIRYNFLDILKEHNIQYVCFKKIEKISKNVNHERLAIEGVLQEALASSDIVQYELLNTQIFLKLMNVKHKNEIKDAVKIFLHKQTGINENYLDAVSCSYIAYKKYSGV